MQRLLVLDNYESFSLVPYLKKKLDCEIFKIGNIYEDRTFNALKRLAPDVVFVDFCDKNALTLTFRAGELSKVPKIVIRLHGYEAFTPYLNWIKWDYVSDLIVVSPLYEKIVRRRIGSKVNVRLVFNGIDLDRFKLQTDEEMDDNTISYVSYLNRKKGMALLRTVMASMPDRRFYVGGPIQEEMVGMYFEELSLENVKYCGLVKAEEFLRGKRFILSTSISESFGMSIAEGMAMGLTPMVHAWPAADTLWPKDCVWATFDELKEIKPKDPVWCREWVEKRYSMDGCVDGVINILK